MDPDANLAEIRQLVAEAGRLNDRPEDHAQVMWRLAELCESLDEWLSRGGVLPKEWNR